MLPNQNKEDIGVIQKITSPILTDQIKDSNGITQRVKSPVMRSKEDSLNRDRKAISPELANQAKDSMREIKRVKSEDKDKTGVNQSEPLGASDSRRAVPAIGKHNCFQVHSNRCNTYFHWSETDPEQNSIFQKA